MKQEPPFAADGTPVGPLPEGDRDGLPEPVLEDHPDWVDLYWTAWNIARDHVLSQPEETAFIDTYLDEAFRDDIIFQWDTCLMMLFAKYANGFVPSIESLDNFYRNQDSDGSIARIIDRWGDPHWLDGKDDPDYTNPPLFAWAEWNYYEQTGDDSRFERVLPVLDNYYRWCERNRTRKNGMYWWYTDGSGMDNSPQGDRPVHGWVDYTAQQAMAADYISRMAEAVDDDELAETYRAEHERLSRLVNDLCWDDVEGLYWDVDADENHVKVKTAASFWPLVAGIADPDQAARLRSHLTDVTEFYRPVLFPALAADDPNYDSAGNYWRGGVWLPTDVMYVKGLQRSGHEDLAAEASMNLLDSMVTVYQSHDPATIWESYAPDFDRPATDKIGAWERLVRTDFVGWSGNGPITLLIENILGIRANAPDNRVTWRPTLTERHGIRNLSFGSNTVDIVAEARRPGDPFEVETQASRRFTLTIVGPGGSHTFDVHPGKSRLTVPGDVAAQSPPDVVAHETRTNGEPWGLVERGETAAVTANVTNECDDDLGEVACDLHVPSDWTAREQGDTDSTVSPAESSSVVWEVEVPSDAELGSETLVSEATFRVGQRGDAVASDRAAAPVTVVANSLASLREGYDEGEATCSGYSREALSRAGFDVDRADDDSVVVGSLATTPERDIVCGLPLRGQTVAYEQPAAELIAVGAAHDPPEEPAHGHGTIHYADGSEESFSLAFNDWRTNKAAEDNELVVTVPNGGSENERGSLVSLYRATVAVNSRKSVEAVSLPSNPNIRLLGLGHSAVTIAMDASARTRPADELSVRATVTNGSLTALNDVALSLDVPDGWTVESETTALPSDVRPGESSCRKWSVSVPGDASGRCDVTACVAFSLSGERRQKTQSTDVEVVE